VSLLQFRSVKIFYSFILIQRANVLVDPPNINRLQISYYDVDRINLVIKYKLINGLMDISITYLILNNANTLISVQRSSGLS